MHGIDKTASFVRLFQTSSRIYFLLTQAFEVLYTNHVFRGTIFTRRGTDILHQKMVLLKTYMVRTELRELGPT